MKVHVESKTVEKVKGFAKTVWLRHERNAQIRRSTKNMKKFYANADERARLVAEMQEANAALIALPPAPEVTN